MNKPAQTLALVALAAVSIAIGLWLGIQSKPTIDEQRSPPGGYTKLGGDFTLESDQGPVHLSDYRGKVVALYFGYTHCPDVCITSLSGMAAAFKLLTPDELAQVQPMFISVDPERDPPAQVGTYARYFHPAFLGLSGSLEAIAEVAKRYLVIYSKVPMENSAMGYAMDHSSIVYVIGRDGIIKTLIHHGEEPAAIAAYLREALTAD